MAALSSSTASTAANLIQDTPPLTGRGREREERESERGERGERGRNREGGWREEDAPFWCRADKNCAGAGDWGCSDDKTARQHITLHCHGKDGLLSVPDLTHVSSCGLVEL